MYPGPINSQEQLRKLTIHNDSSFSDFLPFQDDTYDNMYLQPSSEIQEEVHFKLFPDYVFAYLHNIYGGSDIRRFSIELNDEGVLQTPTESGMSTTAGSQLD